MQPGFFFVPAILLSAWFFARLARTHWLKDRLLECLYSDHRGIWESLGCPCGWQWSPPGRFVWVTFSFPWEWLRTEPDWLANAPELRELFHRVRAGTREWIFRAMPIMVAMWAITMLIVAYLERRH